MPECVRVVPEDLHVSAGRVDLHADELRAMHTAADGRIEAAQVGLPTNSAMALTAAVTNWQADTTIIHGDLVAHGGAPRGAATGYASTENHNAGGGPDRW